MALAVFPGSFDPIHNGHLDVIRDGLAVFGNVVVAVGNNTSKQYLFEPKERARLIERAVDGQNLSGVEVTVFSGLVTTLATDIGADCIIKGVRSTKDLNDELLQANMNFRSSARPGATTIGPMSTVEANAQETTSATEGLNGLVGSASEVRTLFIPAIRDNALISSRHIREINSLGGDVSQLVPEVVAEELNRLYRESDR